MDKEKVQVSMNIILYAGDARLKCKEGLNAISNFDFELARKKLKEATKEITKAHQLQTNAIQGEARGDESEYSLLFAHAQDTLMTVYSELNIAKQLIGICESIDERFQKLEK